MSELSSGTKGAMAELRVAIHLMGLGFHVPRMLSPNSPTVFTRRMNARSLFAENKRSQKIVTTAGQGFRIESRVLRMGLTLSWSAGRSQ